MSTETSKTLRRFWRTIEAIHTVVYFTPEAKSAYNAIGLRGYWSGYFASRSAPLGTPSAELVTATFFGFAPDMVAKAIPDAWDRANRDEILATRRILATRALQSTIGSEDGVAEVADALLEAADRVSYVGRPLATAGLSGREEIEALTDAASNAAISHLQGTPVAESLLGWARSIIKSGVIPFPNATGIPRA